MGDRLTDNEVEQLWIEKVCKPAELGEELALDDYEWEGIWAGFVIALNRPDLAGWEAYQKLGFPHE